MKKLSLFMFLFFSTVSKSQINYNDLRSYYLQGYAGQVDTNEGSDLNQILRMDYFMKPRTKDYANLSEVEDKWRSFLNTPISSYSQSNSVSSNWQPLGPFKIPIGDVARGIGLITTLRIDPADSNKIFAASAHGGLWRTIDGGLSWNNLSDFSLPIIRISDIAIDPLDNNIMYVATGDRDDYHHATLSAGMFRSNDGGITWNAVNSGLVSLISFAEISKILISPSNTNVIYIASSKGIFKTINAKTTCIWEQLTDPLVLNKYFRNILFKPDGFNVTIFASGKDIIKSIDGGLTWNSLTGPLTGLNLFGYAETPFPSRINIACTVDNPEVIYASVILKDVFNEPVFNTNRRHHLFKFDGNLWIEKSGIPFNRYYDGDIVESWIAIDVSPTDENKIAMGCTTVWISNDGGSHISELCSYFCGFMHPDIHDIKYSVDGDTKFFATDGGVFKSKVGIGTVAISDGISANTVTKIGLSATDTSFMLMGAFHSGSNKYDPNNLPFDKPWRTVEGGDGSEQIIDYSNSSILYVSNPKNAITKLNRFPPPPYSLKLGKPLDPECGPDAYENAVFIANYSIHPKNPNKLYVAFSDLYCYDKTAIPIWKKVTDLPTDFGISDCGEFVLAIGISEKEPLVMYISTDATNRIFKTTTGGIDNGCNNNCWTELLPPNPHSITGIAVSYYNPNQIWICYSGYDAGEKVKYYDGSAWQDYSTGLPNLPISGIIYEHGTNDGLYVSTDLGVYYRNHSLSQWEPFNDNLPNVQVSELEINYINNTITAGTYGRGIWKSHLNCPDDFDLTATGNNSFYEAEHNLLGLNLFAPNQILKFRAGNEINLEPGFEVAANSTQEFTAFIHPCNHPGNSFRKANPILPDPKKQKEDVVEKTIEVYPNPNNGNFTVRIPQDQTKLNSIIVVNMTGTIVWSAEKVTTKETIINLENSPKGIYIIKVNSGGQLFYYKISII